MSEYVTLIQDIKNVVGCEATKNKILKLFKPYEGGTIYVRSTIKPSIIQDRIDLAKTLIESGRSRSQVINILIKRKSVSKTTAYKDYYATCREYYNATEQQ